MPKYVKWFVNLLPAQDAWLREVAGRQKPKLKGVEVIRAIIERASLMDASQFAKEIRKARLDAELRRLKDQAEELERKKRALSEEKTRMESKEALPAKD